MASRHRTRARSLQIRAVDVIPGSKARRVGTKQFLVRDLPYITYITFT